MSVFHPRDWIRIIELQKLEKTQARLLGEGLPVPGWLSAKTADLRSKLV